MTNFVHLHVHSDYSLADAAVSIKSLVERAEELGMSHLALTDHGNMFGAMEFVTACAKKKNKVKPIVGCEVYVSPGSRFDKNGAEYENKYYHMVLLAFNRQGYFNLVKICSLAYTEGFYYRPRIDDDLLKKHHEGIIALSACVSGEIPRLIQNGNTEEAVNRAVFYRDLFGKDNNGEPCFYLEIQDHGIPPGYLRGSDLSQKDINNSIIEISKQTGIPLVATNDVHYLKQNDFIAHDVLLCIGTGKERKEEKRKKYFGDQFYFKTGDEMASLFKDYPEAIENTVRIANRCITDVPNIDVKELPKYLPDFNIPSGFENADAYLRHIAIDGLAKRYKKEKNKNENDWENIQKRADDELNTIINMGFTGYFLIVADFIKYANDNGIPVGPGRGSGVGSIVAYSLRITDIEPLKYGLLFERFLNTERISMPDFDIDFANYGRDEVRNYVTTQYGKEKVGKIITFGTLGAKQVIKDVARVLGLTIPDSDMITKLIPSGPDVTLEKSINDEPRLQELEKDARYTELFLLARKLEGLNRHSSIHAAGIVIGKQPLIDLVPLYQERDDQKTGKPGAIATQYDMNYMEPCGLVKMDFLGLKTLDVIKHTEELIRQRGGEYSNFSVKEQPEDDKKTFKMLGEGNSFGIFQFESDGMQDILKQTKPESIADLSALNAMYRPGPMQNIARFVASKNGKEPITYPDPSLERILKETYGVIVYQEQVMEVAKIIAGYSMGKADLLRRAMGKKKKEILDEEKIPFLEGAVKQGFDKKKAGAIYDMLVPFAGYGFNKSHAVAYSVIAYHTAFLKANFLAEFIAANLTNDIHSGDKNRLSHCIDEARKLGLTIDPPCVNKSEKLFTVADGRIVYGFLGIKGIGDAPADEIVKCRQNGPYKSFIDLLNRVNIKIVSKKNIELLIQVGAFDSFEIKRENLLGNLDRAFEYAQKSKEDSALGQTNLFGDAEDDVIPEFEFEEFPKMSRTDRLNLEKKLIGFYFSGHPMDEYKDLWEKAVTVDLSKTDNYKTGSCILIGIISNKKQIITSKGQKMGFATISDYKGDMEMTFFSGVWEKVSDRLEDEKVVILKGRIEYQKDKDKYSFLAEDILSRHEVDAMIKEIAENEKKEAVHRITWKYMADYKSSFITNAKKGTYTVIGYLRKLREHTMSDGTVMAFGTIEDFEGEIEVVFFAKTYAECKHLLQVNDFIALKGRIDPENDKERGKEISLKVSSFADYAALSKNALRKDGASEEPIIPENKEILHEEKPSEIHIKLIQTDEYNEESLIEFRDYFTDKSGNCITFLHIPVKGGEKVILASSGLEVYNAFDAEEIISGLKNLECVEDAWRR